MKYTIEGYSQPRAVELGLGCEELVILRWVADYAASGRMQSITDPDGRVYYWVSYPHLLDDLPIIRCNTKNLRRRFEALVSAGVLTHKTLRNGGTYAMYGFGANYLTLVSSNPAAVVGQNQPTVGQNQPTPWVNNDPPPGSTMTHPLGQNRPNKYPSTNNPSTNNPSTIDIYNTSPEATHERCEAQTDKIDYQSIVDAYNAICTSLPSVKTLTTKRRDALKARLSNGYTSDRLAAIFRSVEESDFLSGRSGQWRASFDWIILERNLVKIEEGNYSNRGITNGATSGKQPVQAHTIHQSADYTDGWD